MHNANFFLKYKLHHILVWLLVFGAWYYLRLGDYGDSQTGLIITLIKVADLAILIYIANYLLIPGLLYKKKYLWFVLIFIAIVAGSSISKMNIIGRIQNNPSLYDLKNNLKARIYDNVIPHFFLVIAGVAVKLLVDYSRLQKRMAETAKEKAEAELNFLKSQINPHFVFNSLNSVYFLIDKNNHEARNALHKFSEMLRYQLYEMNDEKIPVEKEVKYLKDYVDLQQLRKDERYLVKFHSDASVTGFSIEPLLLVPLVENAFKHISHHTHTMNYVTVDMTRQNGHFHFQVKNSKETQPITEEQGGIGLQNVKRRLELLYPAKHQLEITETPADFLVSLKLQLP